MEKRKLQIEMLKEERRKDKAVVWDKVVEEQLVEVKRKRL